MYSKQEIINSFTRELHIIKHLVSKIPHDKYDWRPSPEARSIHELLAYMVRMANAPIELITNGYNPEVMKEMRIEGESKNMATDFVSLLDAQHEAVTTFLTESSDEFLNEVIDIFGTPQPRKQFFFEVAVKNFPAYRMQLFQYLKVGLGMSELNTSNLWMGRDS